MLKKREYRIDLSDGLAKRCDAARFEAARGRRIELLEFYDLRLDTEKLDRTIEVIREPDYRFGLEALRAGSRVRPLKGPQVREFRGYIRRITETRGMGYYLELKDIEQPIYDHETGWFGLTALRPNVNLERWKRRRVYEPYIPGRVVRVEYAFFPKGTYLDGFAFKMPLGLALEADYGPEQYEGLLGPELRD